MNKISWLTDLDELREYVDFVGTRVLDTSEDKEECIAIIKLDLRKHPFTGIMVRKWDAQDEEIDYLVGEASKYPLFEDLNWEWLRNEVLAWFPFDPDHYNTWKTEKPAEDGKLWRKSYERIKSI